MKLSARLTAIRQICLRCIRLRGGEKPTEDYIQSLTKDWDIALGQIPDNQLLPMFEKMLANRTSSFAIAPGEILQVWLIHNEQQKANRVQQEQKQYQQAATWCKNCHGIGWERSYRKDPFTGILVSGVSPCNCDSERISNEPEIDKDVKEELARLKSKTSMMARKYSMQ